jgi:peptide/nickel transport system substrate-binding protein
LKALTIAMEAEPKDPFTGSISGGSGTVAGDIKLAVHQALAQYNDRGDLSPMLATELPTRERGTWVVRPDNTMQTTYRLQRNVTWHDGTPLTAKDFVFAWTVTRDPEIQMRSRTQARQIARIDTPDDYTLVLEWSDTNPFAGAIFEDEIGPFASHIIGPLYASDKERLNNSPYWLTEFVGVGPFRLVEWQEGSHFTLRAYDGFYRGRAKVDTLTFRFIPNEQTVVANMLAGSVDGIVGATLSFSQIMAVRDEWERSGKHPLLVVPVTHWRILEVQFRPDLVRPHEITDPVVRRGLLQGFDRQAMVDLLFDGALPYSDSFVPKDDVNWDAVKDAVTFYPYDPRRAQEVLGQAGWHRGADGVMVNATGERVTIPVTAQVGEQGEQEQAVITAGWRGIGINVDQLMRTPAEARENRLISTFPGFSASAMPLRFQNTTQRFHTSACPGDANRWVGPNHGCYQNGEQDAIIDALQITIDPVEQRRLLQALVRWHTEQLPAMPLYYNPRPMLYREGVVGVKGDTKPRTSQMWNAAEWDIQ